MFSKSVFEMEFKRALEEELKRQGMTIKELADKAGIPPATLYKLTSSERDVRLSTVRRIVQVFEPRYPPFIAVIAAKFLLEEVEGQKITLGDKTCTIRGYTANSIEECIIAAVKAEKDGAVGIVCAPVLASMVEKIVDVPVAIMKPGKKTVLDALDIIGKRIS